MAEIQLQALIRGVILPILVAGAVFIIARVLPVFTRESVRGAGVAAAVLVAHVLLLGLPSWPLTGSPQGVIAALLLASIWPALERMGSRRIFFKRYLAGALVGLILLKPLVQGVWNLSMSVQMILAIALMSSMSWYVLGRAADQAAPSGLAASLMIMAAGSAVAMGMEGSASLAQVTGALAASLGVVAVLSAVGALKAGSEAIPVGVLSLTALWAGHYFYTESHWQSVLGCLAPLAWLGYRAAVKWQVTPVKDALVSALVSLVLLLPGLWLAYERMSATLSD